MWGKHATCPCGSLEAQKLCLTSSIVRFHCLSGSFGPSCLATTVTDGVDGTKVVPRYQRSSKAGAL